MAKRPSVEKAGKLLIAAMRETAEAGDKEGFELVLRAWELDGPAIDAALLAWDEKRGEIRRAQASILDCGCFRSRWCSSGPHHATPSRAGTAELADHTSNCFTRHLQAFVLNFSVTALLGVSR
jgi:hypothetical protein